MASESPLASAPWALTMFSMTNELLAAHKSPSQILRDVIESGVADHIELDAPQHFASFPFFDDQEIATVAGDFERLGITPTIMGVYTDVGRRRDRVSTLDETIAYLARQIEVAAQLGFPATRIAYAQNDELLRGIAPVLEDLGVDLLVEIQGGIRPDETFDRQLEALEAAETPRVGLVFDSSCCMPALPLTYLDELRRLGVPERLIVRLDSGWTEDSPQARKELIATETQLLALSSAAELRLSMVLGRFGNMQVSDWRPWLDRFSAVHLKYWDLEDDGHRVSSVLADVRREFDAAGYGGPVTSEWGGHEWVEETEVGINMSAGHRTLWDNCLATSPRDLAGPADPR